VASAAIELGDRINDLDKDADLKWRRDMAHAFTAVRRPCVHILGNHDAYQLSRVESEENRQAVRGLTLNGALVVAGVL
jgi:hypothetical protein